MEIRIDKTVEKFIMSLEKNTIAKVLRTIDLLEIFNHCLGMPHTRKICPNIFELRVRGKQEIRLMYTFYASEIVILHGFIKKSQKIPRKELEFAMQKFQNLL